jgi:DNA-3-methyladenine glycosylase I
MSCVRCRWCNLNNPVYIAYLDSEWGKPEHDDRKLYELLVLESFQAGLSWEIILNKRENFQQAFDGFDPYLIRTYDDCKIQSLLANSGIIRNRRKIEAAVKNAHIFLEIQKEWGSFDTYIWHFTNGKTIFELGLTFSLLSDLISADLKKRGMKFVGTTVIYSYLQAIGVIYSHDHTCFLYKSH